MLNGPQGMFTLPSDKTELMNLATYFQGRRMALMVFVEKLITNKDQLLELLQDSSTSWLDRIRARELIKQINEERIPSLMTDAIYYADMRQACLMRMERLEAHAAIAARFDAPSCTPR